MTGRAKTTKAATKASKAEAPKKAKKAAARPKADAGSEVEVEVEDAAPARPAKAGPPARAAKKAQPIEPIVEPAEPIVEPPEDDADVDDGADELVAALGTSEPVLDEDEDELDVGPVVDVPGEGMVRRAAVALPEGEWVRDEGPVVDDDHLPPPSGRRDDLYDTFVREATRVPRLSEEEERALGLKVRDQQDQAAARKLVVHNLRLAIKMAHQYKRAWTNLMDLVQEASAGMAIAAQRWDPDQGTRFGTYAAYWIRAQLTKFLMTNGRVIHTGNTRAGRKLYFQLPRVRRKLLAEGKEASIENIAAEVKEDPLEVARVVARLDGREASLDAQIGDDDSGTLGDLIAGDEGDPEDNAARLEVQKVITEVMVRFRESLDNERDLAIWQEHLTAAEPKSLVELGDRYGVSKQRMGQLATRIKRAFRRHVIEELGPTTQLSWLFSTD